MYSTLRVTLINSYLCNKRAKFVLAASADLSPEEAKDSNRCARDSKFESYAQRRT
jgi:hypothetical protein